MVRARLVSAYVRRTTTVLKICVRTSIPLTAAWTGEQKAFPRNAREARTSYSSQGFLLQLHERDIRTERS